MALTPGSRLGSCHVLSTLGEGGMGEVFRATDTKLNRDVAIKVLPEIYVRPYPNVNGGKWQISTTGGTKPVWSLAGGELFYVDANSMLMAVQVQVSPVFKPGIPVKLFEARNIATLASGRFFDVTKDGRRFVMIKELPPPPGAPATTQGPSFVVVVNWIEELKAAIGK